MSTKKDILFTFDYELFLGRRSGTVDNCMIIPTNKVLDIFQKYSVKNAIFFVDTTYLLTLKSNPDPRCRADLKKIIEQLRNIVQLGHYIFPHLHPHWLDAKYLPHLNQWDLSNAKRYSFSSLEVQARADIFSGSVELLDHIRGTQEKLGYRAGGWCIQPFADFKEHFIKHGIVYDFSVMPGYSCNTEFQHFDFRITPRKKIYRFSKETNIEDSEGLFTEFCISTLQIHRFSRMTGKLLLKILAKRGIRNFGDGISAHSASLKQADLANHEMASIELLHAMNLKDYLAAIRNCNYFHFISHPKMLSPHNLACLDKMLKNITERYEINTDFAEALTDTPLTP